MVIISMLVQIPIVMHITTKSYHVVYGSCRMLLCKRTSVAKVNNVIGVYWLIYHFLSALSNC